uniref:envelope membrane protein n=1 Tax=Anemia phyllitidis TaxID=12940 RepID=UPI0021AC157D|nr:envelope membrane protein [Anemia phyllitidis]UUL71086.1 envelope membrane protein [Anemia phyllitidis]
MKLDCWKITQQFHKIPYRSLDRAYEASKQIQSVKKKSFYHMQVKAPSKFEESSQPGATPLNKEFGISKFIIYWSLLEYRLSLFLLGLKKNLVLFHSFPREVFLWPPLVANHYTSNATRMSSIKNKKSVVKKYKSDTFLSHYSDISLLKSRSRKNRHRGNRIAIDMRDRIEDSATNDSEINTCVSPRKQVLYLKNFEQMNRKLVWIEAVLNDSNVMEEYTAPPLTSIDEGSNKRSFIRGSIDFSINSTAYESTSLIPRSINRTLSKFETELTSQASPLVLHDFQLAKHQALASLQYIGYLLIVLFLIPTTLINEFVETWVRRLWNTSQSQIFFNSFQEEKALNQLHRIEGLLWLNEMTRGPASIQLQDCNVETCGGTIQSIVMYNELNIQIASHLVSDVISFVISIFLLVVGQKRLAVLNSWIQELFYSSNDTMKAFSILLVTDLCVGFHSPHGWEIVTGCFLEHLGFARNKYVISCFVSTFPVILDTVSKYWIFRHPNRTSPSIVATYHTTNE